MHRLSIYIYYPALLALLLQFSTTIANTADANSQALYLMKNAKEIAMISPKKAYYLADSAYRISLKLKDYNSQAEALLIKGSAMLELGKYQGAIDTLNISLRLYQSFIEKSAIAINLTMLGRAYTQIGMYSTAKDNFILALDYYNNIDKKKLKQKYIYIEFGRLYNYIGLLNKRMNNNQIALNYHFKELQIYKEVKDTLLIGACYGDIGRMYRYINKLDSSLYYTYRGYEIVRQFDNTIYLAHIEKKMGLVCTEMGNYLEAMKYFSIALDRYREFDDQQGITVCLNHIGRIHCKNNNHPLAQKYFDSALTIAKQTLDIDNLQYIYKFKAEAYQESADYFNSLNSYLNYFAIKDSVNSAEKDRYIQEIEAKFKLKDKEFYINSIENKNFQLIIFLIAISAILIIFIIWSIRRNHLRKSMINRIDSVQNKDVLDNDLNFSSTIASEHFDNRISESFKSILGYIRLLKIENQKIKNQTIDSYLERLEFIHTHLNTLILSNSSNNVAINCNHDISHIDLTELLTQCTLQYPEKIIDGNLTVRQSDSAYMYSNAKIIQYIIYSIFNELLLYKTNEIKIGVKKQDNTNSYAITISSPDNAAIIPYDSLDNKHQLPVFESAKFLANLINSRVEIKTIFGEIIEINVYLYSYDIDNQI